MNFTGNRFQRQAIPLTPPGNKKDNITIIYTPWSNLKKDGSMAVGQVSFKDQKKVGTLISGPNIMFRILTSIG